LEFQRLFSVESLVTPVSFSAANRIHKRGSSSKFGL